MRPVAAHFVHGHHVGMAQPSHGARLGEPPPLGSIAVGIGVHGPHELERYAALQTFVIRRVHHPQGALAQSLPNDETVDTDGLGLAPKQCRFGSCYRAPMFNPVGDRRGGQRRIRHGGRDRSSRAAATLRVVTQSVDDADLLDAWALGDQDAGRQLYRRHCDAITAFITRKTEHDVADLVQRTFAQCLAARRDQQTRINNPRAYLYRVARNALFDQIRSQARFAQLDPSVSSFHDVGPGPSTALLADQSLRQLLAALRRVPLDDQIALELRYWEGLSMLEIADVLQIGRSAAISRVHRARAAVRAALQALGASEASAEATITNFEAWKKSLRSKDASSVYDSEPGEGAAPRNED